MRVQRRHLTVGLCLGLWACGGSSAPETATEPTESEGAERPEASSKDELAITGLRGTLSQSEIQNALEPRMLKFSRCVQRRSADVEWISGNLEFSFHVALDGSVASVFPSAGGMGDRDTERCMLDVAKSVRFPAPHGGEADFSWPLEVPLDPEVRAPVPWDASQANEVMLANAQAALEACGGGAFSITAYIDPDGHVVSAGAVTSNVDDAGKLDCITDAIKAWTFPSPGSYAAKVSFGLR